MYNLQLMDFLAGKVCTFFLLDLCCRVLFVTFSSTDNNSVHFYLWLYSFTGYTSSIEWSPDATGLIDRCVLVLTVVDLLLLVICWIEWSRSDRDRRNESG
jgi:hypothetical protein